MARVRRTPPSGGPVGRRRERWRLATPLSFTDGVSRIQLVANPAEALENLAWQASTTVSKATNKPLKVAQAGSTFYALFSSPEKMSVYVWGDVSNKDQILEFASILTQRALLGYSR
jgi:hypothetical protein